MTEADLLNPNTVQSGEDKYYKSAKPISKGPPTHEGTGTYTIHPPVGREPEEFGVSAEDAYYKGRPGIERPISDFAEGNPGATAMQATGADTLDLTKFKEDDWWSAISQRAKQAVGKVANLIVEVADADETRVISVIDMMECDTKERLPVNFVQTRVKAGTEPAPAAPAAPAAPTPVASSEEKKDDKENDPADA